ncbi:MAG TPA: hypothetical protein PLN86_05740 [Candidatus Hydrogenedentes bacterium]|nr:hypothetical protein [Candidatus Hydrogenedentota bacterium]
MTTERISLVCLLDAVPKVCELMQHLPLVGLCLLPGDTWHVAGTKMPQTSRVNAIKKRFYFEVISVV